MKKEFDLEFSDPSSVARTLRNHLQSLLKIEPLYTTDSGDDRCMYCNGSVKEITRIGDECHKWAFVHDSSCDWRAAKAYLEIN